MQQQLRQLRQGQRIRIVFEGPVCEVTEDVVGIKVSPEAERRFVFGYRGYPDPVIELVEPDYEEGEPYRDENGEVWIYHAQTVKGRAWTCTGSAGLHEFDVPLRPLVHLVAEGV